ncbi:MAG: serine/threonine protein phosphatase [Eubacterium sp.]|nr:serine/threonine protein phosphatase [Eubacterium sp.]
MGIFKKDKTEPEHNTDTGTAVMTGGSSTHPFRGLNSYEPLSGKNGRVYRELREAVPLIDSAIYKIVRLMGGFEFKTGNEALDNEINEFFSTVSVGGNQQGIQAFVDNYMEQLLTYGSAVGEMLYDENGFYALYNGELDVLQVKRKKDGIEPEFFNVSSGREVAIASPEKLLFSVLNPEPGSLVGTSLLRGLPFVSDILLKIYNTIGTNWERVGNLRYAVTYKPQNDSTDKAYAKERANQMAQAWKDAMSSKENVKDFVAVGDVKISVIGADNQVLDSEVPARQMLEQIIAKTGLMPYMFGLSWSTTEHMSQQQADILTTELEAYRRIVTPVIKKIGEVYLLINGITSQAEVVWDDITLQDETQLAQARLYNAEADKYLKEAQDATQND